MVRNRFMGKIAFAATFSIFLAPSVFAGLVSCFTSTATSVTAAGSQVAGAPIAAAGAPPGDDFNTLSNGGVTGCSGVDINFQNFSETGVTISGLPSGASNYISTLSNQDLTAGSVTAIFSTVRGTDVTAGTGTGADGNKNDGLNNWLGTSGGATFTTNYTAAATNTGFFQFFELNLNGVQLGAGTTAGTLTGTVDLCLGGTWSGTTCSSGNSHLISIVSGTNNYSFSFTSTTQIGILNSFTLTNASGGSGTSAITFLTSFDEVFSESTPEPATFALLGTALTGLGFLRRLRKH